MNDREGWRERDRDICASGTTWWWWLIYAPWNDQTVLFQLIWFRYSIEKRQHFSIKVQSLLFLTKDYEMVAWVRESDRRGTAGIGPAVRVFANGPGDLGSIPGRVIPKTLKMVLDTTLLNTQHYKVRFKGKVEQSWEWSSALPYTLV